MAFFEDLGKKISNVSQSAVQKGKEMADIAKLNSMISDEEKKITNLHTQIGKLYVELKGDSAEEAFTEFIALIHASEEKIAEYKEKLAAIKNVTKCPSCGAEMPNGTMFCSTCGSKMPEVVAPAQNSAEVKCSNCGAVIPEGTKFCTSCGQKVADETEANN